MTAVATSRRGSGRAADEIRLTPEGYAALVEEHRRLTTLVRPEAATRLKQALDVPGDLADNPEYLDASGDLDRIDGRVALLEERLSKARVLVARPPGRRVSMGSRVVLEDLDDGSRDEYLLVSSAESNPAESRLSNESPVGAAVTGRRIGDVVDVRAPHRIRHLRIAQLG